MNTEKNDKNEYLRSQLVTVGIMTWYRSWNYGTVLQASALYKVVSDIGFKPKIIQYHIMRTKLKNMTLQIFFKKVCNRLKKYLFEPKVYNNCNRERLFLDYLEARIIETEPIITDDDFSKLNDNLDVFICGSDQIWSPLCFDEKYYLSFVKDNKKKIAYAPSMGVFEINDENIKQRIKILLKDFEYLSVREKQGAKIIKELIGKETKVALDPTLLLTASEWDSYANTDYVSELPKPYILCYYLGKPSRYRKYVDKFSKKHGFTVYEIPTIREYGRYAKFPFEVGPREFVSLIKNASFVFTDSYHGMIFSIIYQVPFFVFERFEKEDTRNQNSRIYSLIKLLGLENRLLRPTDICKIDIIPALDFEDYYDRLKTMRERSLEYLKQALDSALT